jgi:hypothetical protein
MNRPELAIGPTGLRPNEGDRRNADQPNWMGHVGVAEWQTRWT